MLDDDIPTDKDIFKESILKLKSKHAKEAKKELRAKIKEAEASGDEPKWKELISEYGRINSEGRNG